MISIDEFLDLVRSEIHRDLRNPDNLAQLQAVTAADDTILQVVAGPGSGKTTVLVLRALRYVFVDDILPESILITTFTRKASKELRTRWLDWGMALCRALESNHNLEHVDLNRCRIDTLDSIVQQSLTEFRLPGTLAPILAETSASRLILKRYAFQASYRPNQGLMDNFFSRYTFEHNPPSNQGEALRIASTVIDRLVQDRVDLGHYAQSGQAQSIIVQMLESFRQRAIESNVFNYTLLQEQFLNRLENNTLEEWHGTIRALLIDEYQDTNPLQEAIYFKIIELARPYTTIVGDDDQSMYRFRGGSVELFTQFSQRCHQVTGITTLRIDMIRNFRSRPEIVQFYNRHITCDPEFTSARINPPKPEVIESRESGNIPVLGMFRQDQETLAHDLAEFLDELIRQRSVDVGNGHEIRLSPDGDLGDIVFLAHSIEEQKYNRYKTETKIAFPHMFREELQARALHVFNPRGTALRTIPVVGQLLGLVLLALDPDNTMLDNIRPTNEARFFMTQWRDLAENFVNSNPLPNDGNGLQGFIFSWQNAARGTIMPEFPRDWPVLELIFKLITWLPGFQTDPEHQVWLEAITRIVSSAGMASPYGMHLFQNYIGRNNQQIVQIRQRHDGTTVNDVEESRRSIVRDALLPIAEDEVDVDEDIIPSVPRNWLQFMTIHQSKGLEFPLVIVDVGNQFRTNNAKQRFLRFPDGISNVVQAEDDVEPFLSSPLRFGRSGRDRTFDDLVRLYYVAFSRPQSVMLLIGCEKCLTYGKGRDNLTGIIPHVALGWRRDGSWSWRQPYTTRKPPVMIDNPPFQRM